QDAEAAVNDCVDQYPERQLVRSQPVKNAGDKAYSHRDHCRFLARLKPRGPCRKSSNFLTSTGTQPAVSVNGAGSPTSLTSSANAPTNRQHGSPDVLSRTRQNNRFCL